MEYTEHHEKRPLAGVIINVKDAGSKTSSQDGSLTLQFNTLKPGNKVELTSAKKEGYEIMNKDGVKQWFISSDNTPFTILLIKSNYFTLLKQRITQTSTNSYKTKFNKAKKEIEELKKNGKIKEDEYNQRLEELEQERKNALQNLNNYIDQFARIDLSEVSEEEQKILNMVEQGQIDEAVKAYDELNISNKLRQARDEIKKLTEAEVKISDKKAEKTNEIKELIAKQEREIATLKIAGGKDNFDKICRILKENALADTSNLEEVIKYADFAYTQNNYKEAEKFYLICLNGSDLLYNFLALYGLAQIFEYTNRENLAEECLEFVLKVLENTNEKDFLAISTSLQVHLGALYAQTEDYIKANEFILHAIEGLTQLSDQNSEKQRNELASIWHNLGVYYNYAISDYTKAEEFLLKALENFNQLFNQDPDTYRGDLAKTQHSLGNLYSKLDKHTRAEEFYHKALESYNQLFDQNPDAYRKELAATQKSLANWYFKLPEYTKAEEFYLKTLENYDQLFIKDPNTYRENLAWTQFRLGDVYCNVNKDSIAEGFYLKALENYNQLFIKDPKTYREDLAWTQDKLGDVYCNVNKDSIAEGFYLKALENYRLLLEEKSDTFLLNIGSVQFSLLTLYYNESKLDKYYTMIDASLNTFEVLFQKYNKYKSQLVFLRNQKGERYLEENDLDKAIELSERAYELDPEKSAVYLAEAFNRKAYEYARLNDFNKAIETIEKAIGLQPENANYYDSKGEILLMTGDEQGALDMWTKVMRLEPDFLLYHNNGTQFYNQLKKRGLIE